MSFVHLTRADKSPVVITIAKILSFAPVPTEGPLLGPLMEGTRIVFINKNGHQDVMETVEIVSKKLRDSNNGG
ncbi:hypothetical protein [Hoeflea sp.]|uniref:hypothetical protein n=1 Tax=Hoeflea sp. TaxID=1940281 RepID=UPI003A8E946F